MAGINFNADFNKVNPTRIGLNPNGVKQQSTEITFQPQTTPVSPETVLEQSAYSGMVNFSKVGSTQTHAENLFTSPEFGMLNNLFGIS